MSRWKQWVKEPRGALPGGIVTKVGIALIAVLVAGLLFSSSLAGPDEDTAVTGAPSEPRALNDREGRSFLGRIRDERERESQRAESESRDGAAGGQEGQAPGGESGGSGAGAGAPPVLPHTAKPSSSFARRSGWRRSNGGRDRSARSPSPSRTGIRGAPRMRRRGLA